MKVVVLFGSHPEITLKNIFMESLSPSRLYKYCIFHLLAQFHVLVFFDLSPDLHFPP